LRARRLAALVWAVVPTAIALAAPPSSAAGSAEEPKRSSDARPGSARANAAAVPRRQRARPPARLWSLYPAGDTRIQTAPALQTTARPTTPPPQARTPRPSQPRATRGISAKEPAAPGLDERPWLLGAGVGIALGLGLLVLLALLVAGLRARPSTRSRASTSRALKVPPPAPAKPAPRVASDAPPAWQPAPARAAAAPPPPEPSPAGENGDGRRPTYLVLLPAANGYSLIQSEGDAPAPGTVLAGDALRVQGRFVVSRVGPSPLPLDPRRCAYLERSDA
jgi:hypothetical protein